MMRFRPSTSCPSWLHMHHLKPSRCSKVRIKVNTAEILQNHLHPSHLRGLDPPGDFDGCKRSRVTVEDLRHPLVHAANIDKARKEGRRIQKQNGKSKKAPKKTFPRRTRFTFSSSPALTDHEIRPSDDENCNMYFPTTVTPIVSQKITQPHTMLTGFLQSVIYRTHLI